jgi:hypothetical protein
MQTPGGRPRGQTASRTGLGLVGLALWLGACGSGGGGGQASGHAAGTVLAKPGGLSFVVDANHGGQGGELRLNGAFWGRLVEVVDVGGTRVFADFVIGEDIQSDGVTFELERNPVTEVETLRVLHANGTAAFEAAARRLDANVQYLLDKGLGPNTLPPFTRVARNAALVLRFDDLLDASSIAPENVKVLVGYPPTAPFELRMMPDPSHGDLAGGTFYSTRVILDLSVSKLEASIHGLAVNSIGLPGAITTQQPNLAVRIPTELNAAATQFTLLRSAGGAAVRFNGNGPNDPFAPTLDIVRAARSGGIEGDPNNGFLVDGIEPEIVGAQAVSVFHAGATPQAGTPFPVDVVFTSALCAARPRAGDILELPAHTLQVTQAGAHPINGAVDGVAVELLVGDPLTFFSSTGQYRTVWDPQGGAPPACFVRFSPAAGTAPDQDVRNDADVIVSFSEPMDPGSIQAFDTFTLTYGVNPAGTNPIYARVSGNVRASTNLLDFAFEPVLPLRNHGSPTTPPESYVCHVVGDDASTPSVTEGVTDLAGNRLRVDLPAFAFHLDPSQPKVNSKSISLNFSSVDEDQNGAPEMIGQFLVDPVRGQIRPRAVTRFSGQVDPSHPVPGSMVQIPAPIVTPLSSFGSRMMGVWRYFDMGFTLLDPTNHNLDLEGLWWEPYAGSVTSDFFSGFELTVSHTKFLPDENIGTPLLPTYGLSGLVNGFSNNRLDVVVPGTDPPTVLHSRFDGYLIQPADMVPSPNSRNVMPWPVNRGKPQSEWTYWTWRDTSITAVAAPNGAGADPKRLEAIAGTPHQKFYKPGGVPTVGLPMLLDFKTWPDTGASGQNGFQIAIALNSSARPYFRTFSTGGALSSGQIINVLPDQETKGSGGVNPNNGNKTPPQDNAVYFGQADFVVRVNRAHSIWFDTLTSSAATSFGTTVVEPSPALQPAGTAVTLAYRGATVITGTTTPVPWHDASLMDAYGDKFGASQLALLGLPASLVYKITHLTQKENWRPDIADLNGARFVQVRVTMIANPETALAPTLSAFGLSFLD